MSNPKRGKKYELFSWLRETDQSSGHSTHIFSKRRKEEQGKPHEWLHKKFDKAELAEIEAAMAALYALFEPDAIPKMRALFKEGATDSFENVSKMFPDFQSLEAYLNDVSDKRTTEEKINALIEFGLPELLVLSQFFEEDDLHKRNIGILKNKNKMARVDFDMSAYSIVSQERFRDARTRFSASSEKSFLFDKNIIDHFPKIPESMNIGYWVTRSSYIGKSQQYSPEEAHCFSKLCGNEAAETRAFLMRLKISLMPDEVISNTLANHIKKPETLKLFQDHFVMRKYNQRKALFDSHKFPAWWEKASVGEIKSMFLQFEAHNQNLKQKYQNEKIDIATARSLYYLFCRNMIEDKMKQVLIELGEMVVATHDQSLIVLQKIIRDQYLLFSKKNVLTEDDFKLFIDSVRKALNGNIKPCLATDKLQAVLTQLKKYDFNAEDALATAVVQHDSECVVTKLNLSVLAENVKNWIGESRNAQVILNLSQKLCREQEEASTNKSWVSRSVSSIWSLVQRDPEITFESLVAKMADVREARQMGDIVTEITALAKPNLLQPDCMDVSTQFVLRLFQAFIDEFSKLHIVDQVHLNPNLAACLYMQPIDQLLIDQTTETIKKFGEVLSHQHQSLDNRASLAFN